MSTKLEDEGLSTAPTLIAELEANALSFGAEGTGDKWGNERLSIALARAVEVEDKGLIIACGIERHNTQDLQQADVIKPELFRHALQDNGRSMMRLPCLSKLQHDNSNCTKFVAKQKFLGTN
jgi:hypothetical protein